MFIIPTKEYTMVLALGSCILLFLSYLSCVGHQLSLASWPLSFQFASPLCLHTEISVPVPCVLAGSQFRTSKPTAVESECLLRFVLRNRVSSTLCEKKQQYIYIYIYIVKRQTHYVVVVDSYHPNYF
jgi:hypothetical protein